MPLNGSRLLESSRLLNGSRLLDVGRPLNGRRLLNNSRLLSSSSTPLSGSTLLNSSRLLYSAARVLDVAPVALLPEHDVDASPPAEVDFRIIGNTFHDFLPQRMSEGVVGRIELGKRERERERERGGEGCI